MGSSATRIRLLCLLLVLALSVTAFGAQRKGTSSTQRRRPTAAPAAQNKPASAAPAADEKAAPKEATAAEAAADAKTAKPEPAVKEVTPALTDLPRGTALPIRIGVSVFVNDIGKIDEQNGTFEATLILKYFWRDPRLAFDPREVASDQQDFADEEAIKKLSTIWTPALVLTNLKDKPAHEENGLLIRSDGSVTQVQSLRATFDGQYALAAFPFDKQKLPVRITSQRYNFNEVALIQSQKEIDLSGLSDELRIAGWRASALDFKASRIQGWNGDFYPEMTGKIVVRRDPLPHLFVIFTPLLLIMLVATIMTLYAKTETAFRLSAWSGSILALVALNFTFSVRYPFLGSDSVVQQLVVIGFNFQLLMVFLTLTIFNPEIAGKIPNQDLVLEIRSFLRWSIPLLLLGMIVTACLLTAFT